MVTKKKVTKAKTKKPLTKWQLHLNKTWKEMKKKNPSAKFSDAMSSAKKTYVAPKKPKKK
jgi:hypothetical protein